MSMERIVASLQASGNDKKDTLTNSYQEKSVWLRNEFDVIRKLIKQSPRENLTNQEAESDAIVPVVSSSSSAREMSGDGRKRKSPETVNAVKLSPQQKRASIDVDDLVYQAGLPSDLNKMKKEKLLAELEKRGNTQFSMKNVKNALIDALKDTLLSEYQNRDTPEQPILQNAQSDPAEPESTSMVMSTPSKPAPMRGSLMADFRSLVQNGNAGASTENSAPAKLEAVAEEQKKRIETEYNARMHRQRESVAARQSILNVEVSAAAVVTTAAVEEKVEVNVPAPAPAPAVVASAPVLSLEAPSSVASKDAIGSTASEGSIWMEVSSPVRTSAPEATTTEEEGPVVAAAVESAAAVRSRAGSDASFQSCASTGTSASTPPAPVTTISSASATVTHTTSRTTSPAKPRAVNNTSGSLSVKPVEASLKLSSKPVDAKPTSTVASTARKSGVPARQSIRPTTTVPSTNSNPMPVATPARVMDTTKPARQPPASAVPKKGVFSFWAGGAKKVDTPCTPSPALAPAPAPALVSAVAGPKMFSPAGAKAPTTKSASPAVVDSIIKSAKMNSAVVPPKTSSSSTSSNPCAPNLVTSVASPEVVPVNEESGSGAVETVDTPVAMVVASAPARADSIDTAPAELRVLKDITPPFQGSAGQAALVACTPVVPPTAEPLAGTVVPDPVTTASTVSTVSTAAVDPPAQEYEMSDREDSDEEEEGSGGTDDEAEEGGEEGEEGANKKPKKNIPEWARGQPLKEALMRQYGLCGGRPIDPDVIFPDPVATCSLEEIFGAQQVSAGRRYAARGSSAHWDADQMSLVDKRQYRNHMGYEKM